MELPKVERSAVAGRDLAAQALDLALADLVRQRLRRPADVAVGLDDGVGLREARAEEQVDRLLAGPAEGMEAGVHDQAGGAPRLGIEHPEALRLVAVQAHLVGEPLRVQAPALDIGAARVARGEAPEHVELGVLALERDLEVVARDGLVIRRGREARVDARRQIEGVDVVRARPGRVRRGREVVRERRVTLLVLLDRDDPALRDRESPEHPGCELVGALDVLGRARDEGLAGRVPGSRGRPRGTLGRPRCRRRSPPVGRSSVARSRWSRARPARSGGPPWRPGRGSSSAGSGCGTGRLRRAPTRCRSPPGTRRGTHPGAPRGTRRRPDRPRRE